MMWIGWMGGWIGWCGTVLLTSNLNRPQTTTGSRCVYWQDFVAPWWEWVRDKCMGVCYVSICMCVWSGLDCFGFGWNKTLSDWGSLGLQRVRWKRVWAPTKGQILNNLFYMVDVVTLVEIGELPQGSQAVRAIRLNCGKGEGRRAERSRELPSIHTISYASTFIARQSFSSTTSPMSAYLSYWLMFVAALRALAVGKWKIPFRFEFGDHTRMRPNCCMSVHVHLRFLLVSLCY